MPKLFYTLITGASRGLGKALALECARRGMNLILVALPEPALYQTAHLIRTLFPVDVVCIEKDLCTDDGCTGLLQEVKALNLPVNMLLNNAGLGGTEWFENNCAKFYEKQIRLNVLATAQLTRLFLPLLKQNSPSHILNVGSLASFFSLPKKAVYSGTKSFVYSFSRSLRLELLKDRVHVSVVCPGGLLTCPAARQMVKEGNYLSRASCMEPEDVAPQIMRDLLRKKEVIVPGTLNRAFLLLDKLLPTFLKRRLVAWTMHRLNSKTFVQNQNDQHDLVPVLPLLTNENTYSVKIN